MDLEYIKNPPSKGLMKVREILKLLGFMTLIGQGFRGIDHILLLLEVM